MSERKDVRRFWLTNSKGERFSLMGQEPYLHNPSGLGYQVELQTVQLGTNQLITAERYDLGTFTADLVFFGNRPTQYQAYQTFLRFIRWTPLQLHYAMPNSDAEFYCYVRINSLQKSEISPSDNVLHIPVTMLRQSMWYSGTENMIEVDNAPSYDYKEYALTREYIYGENSTGYVELYSDGQTDTPFRLEVSGSATNFEYEVYDYNIGSPGMGEKYGAGKISGTYDVIIINSDELNETLYLENGGSVISNAVNYQDLTVGSPPNTYVTFIKLRPGRSGIYFTYDNAFAGSVKVSWRNAYVTI